MANLDPDPSDEPSDEEDDDQSSADEFLRAVAAAPRPRAEAVLARALPDVFADTVGAGGELSTSTPRPGDVVDGRYRIDEVIGSGGMGVVFGATHTQTGRRVALKWMLTRGLYRTQSERDASVQRFVREAQAAGRIRHPNVVDVYDAGTDPDAPYLVMERLEGETLRARIERAPLAWDEALALIIPVMRGVAEAHRQGVVHRDIKPDNVFLARDKAGASVAKVLDFGVSRLHANDAAEPSLTRTGAVIGTPAYMPLEQLRADGNVDERTDIYALGVVLYEMLTQRRPYLARNAADFAVLLASEPPTPLSKLKPELKGTREAAVMKALARDPRERYASIEAFVEALERVDLAPSRGTAKLARWAVGVCVLLGAAAWFARAHEHPTSDASVAPLRVEPAPQPVAIPAPPSAPPNVAPPEPPVSPESAPGLIGPPQVAAAQTGTVDPKAGKKKRVAPRPVDSPAPAVLTVPPRADATALRREDFRASPAREQPSGASQEASEAPRTLDLGLGRDQF